MFLSTARPIIFGHRGASAHAPENTLAAFELAYTQGAAGIELDAKLTSDGTVVVIHDQTVDRTTDGRGKVNGLTLKAIKALDAGSSFAPSFKGEPVPTLEEVFQAVGQRLLINIELTNYASLQDPLPELAAELVIKYNLEKRVIASSFSAANLVRFRRRLPGVPVCLLALKGLAGFAARSWLLDWRQFDGLNPFYSDVFPGLVQRQHRKGRVVIAWTVDQPQEMRRLASMAVDGLITDNPVLACRMLNSQSQAKPEKASV